MSQTRYRSKKKRQGFYISQDSGVSQTETHDENGVQRFTSLKIQVCIKPHMVAFEHPRSVSRVGIYHQLSACRCTCKHVIAVQTREQ